MNEAPGWLKDLLSPSDGIRWLDNVYYQLNTNSDAQPLFNSCLAYLNNADNQRKSISYTDGIKTVQVTRVRSNNGFLYYEVEEFVNIRRAYIPITGGHPCDCEKALLLTKGCQCDGQ